MASEVYHKSGKAFDMNAGGGGGGGDDQTCVS